VIRDDLADARYAVLAWTQGVAWMTALAGLGMVATGYARRDSTLFASGVSVAVSAFLPRLKPLFAFEIARTLAMKWGWATAPAPEYPTTPPREEP
jgi:hypothetical protein